MAGRSVQRTDALLKVAGKLKYGADYGQEGFLHGKILRSPHPHALIRSIRTEKAQALPGVVAVLTARDVPGRNGFGAIIPDQPVICGDKVRYVGDGVALVAAETEQIAQQALELIEVDYEPLPAVLDPREAMKEDAPKIHEKGNLLSYNKLRKGDLEKGWAEADVIMERTYQVPFLEHAYIEPDVAMAVPQADGTMLVEGPMQAPFTTRRNLAAVLGVPINQVRVRQVPMGGGFGGKEDSPIDIGCRAAVLARHTGRPVRLALEREEVTLQTCKRHPMIMTIKLGARKDGTLTAFQGMIYDEQGAYASLGPVIPPAGGSHIHSMIMMPGPYEIPHVRVDAYLCYTNHPYGGAMRGFGAPQVHIAHEQIMDELALELGMDPLEIRRKNAFKLGSTTATGQVLDQSVGLRRPWRPAPGNLTGSGVPGKPAISMRKRPNGGGSASAWAGTGRASAPAAMAAGPMSMCTKTARCCCLPASPKWARGPIPYFPRSAPRNWALAWTRCAWSSRTPIWSRNQVRRWAAAPRPSWAMPSSWPPGR